LHGLTPDQSLEQGATTAWRLARDESHEDRTRRFDLDDTKSVD
jgi:hypothetical protein